MSYHDEDDFLDERTGPYFIGFGALIAIAVISGMIYNSFEKKKLKQIYTYQLNNSEIYFESNTKEILDQNKINLAQYSVTDNQRINYNEFYRFGFINKIDTIWYRLHTSRIMNEKDLFLLDEKNDVIIGKYTIK